MELRAPPRPAANRRRDRRVADEVWIANYNGPGQVVIAGSPEAVHKAGVVAKELGAKLVNYGVSGATTGPTNVVGRLPAFRSMETTGLHW